MLYLIIQIALCLILAAIIGFLLGWILKIWPKRGQIDELKIKIDSFKNEYDDKIAGYEKRIYDLEHPPPNTEIDDLKSKINVLSQKCDSKDVEFNKLKTLIDNLNKNCNSNDSDLEKRITELEKKPKIVPKNDDLKKIYGVNKVLEKFLHNHGIYSFRDVAILTQKDVEKIAEDLPGFHDRILRDEWSKQCKKLHYDKYGERL